MCFAGCLCEVWVESQWGASWESWEVPVYSVPFAAVQSQKAVTAYFPSKQLLPFGFAVLSGTL